MVIIEITLTPVASTVQPIQTEVKIWQKPANIEK